MKELLNFKLQFIIVGKDKLFKTGQVYMNGYYFKNCMIYIKCNLLDKENLPDVQHHTINMPENWK